MRRSIALIALWCGALSCLLAACSSSAKPASAPSTTAATTSTTTAPNSTTTTIATTTKQSVFVLSVDPTAHTITVDPMEFLTGAAATSAYHAANPKAPPGGPDNDYFIVNKTKDHVVMPLDADVNVRVVQAGGSVHNPPVSVPLTTLVTYPALAQHPFWITTERGTVTKIDEQFVP